MRKKALILGAVLTLSAMTFVGCGNKDANNSTTDQTTGAPDATDNSAVGQEPDTGTNGNDDGGVVDDLEDGAEDVGDAVGDAVDDLDGDTTGNDTTGNDTTGNDTTGNDTTGKGTKKK